MGFPVQLTYDLRVEVMHELNFALLCLMLRSDFNSVLQYPSSKITEALNVFGFIYKVLSFKKINNTKYFFDSEFSL